MTEQEAERKLRLEIQGMGYDEWTAAKYAALIGDIPFRDHEGNVLVMEGPRVLARLKGLKFFGEGK